MKFKLPPWSRLVRKSRVRRTKRQRDKNPLREFLYLDDVSVNSLYASRLGPLPSDYTDTAQVARQAEVAADASGNFGVASAKGSTKFNRSDTRTSQVVRKASLQVVFKDWLEFERDSLLHLDPEPPRVIRNAPKNLSEMKTLLDGDGGQELGFRAEALKRGQVVELGVELSSSQTYRLSSAVSEIVGVVKGSPNLFGVSPTQVEEVEAFSSIVERFLVDLIPLQCPILDHEVVVLDGGEYVVRTSSLRQLDDADSVTKLPLYVVAVTESQLFWKDVRRILFSGARVTLVGRILHGGMSNTWNDVKLLDLLAEFSPDMASAVRGGLKMLGPKLASDGETEEMQLDASFVEVLKQYRDRLATEYSVSSSGRNVGEIAANGAELSDPRQRRDSFRKIEQEIEEISGSRIDPEAAKRLREELLATVGIGQDGVLATKQNPQSPVNVEPPSRYLEVEVIAIYR